MSGSVTVTVTEATTIDVRPIAPRVQAELDQLLPSLEKLLPVKPDVDVRLPVSPLSKQPHLFSGSEWNGFFSYLLVEGASKKNH
jgi:hypothetical protein